MNLFVLSRCLSMSILILSTSLIFTPKIIFEIYNIKKYNDLCKKGILINKKHFEKVSNPKISIISPVYNREKHLMKFVRSIQNQNIPDIEIILVDDFSTDESVKIINQLKIEDERIILLQNKRNKGTLISRNIAG